MQGAGWISLRLLVAMGAFVFSGWMGWRGHGKVSILGKCVMQADGVVTADKKKHRADRGGRLPKTRGRMMDSKWDRVDARGEAVAAGSSRTVSFSYGLG